MHCAFIVRASAQIGIGHLMRCMALAQALIKKGHTATFLLDQETEALAKSQQEWCGDIIYLDYDVAVEEQISCLCGKQTFTADWIVIDGYNFDRDYCLAWQNNEFKIALIDDDIHQPPFAVDLLINPSTDKTTTDDGIPILSGSQYRMLRREFVATRPLPQLQRRFLTLSFGGSDPANITIPLLSTLDKLNIKAPVRVVTGQAYPYLRELAVLVEHCSLDVEHVHAAQNMAEIWSETKLAVSAAGGSQFELAVCATPSVLVVVADNQLQASERAAHEGWCLVADLSTAQQRDSGLNNLGKKIVQLWNDDELLVKMHKSIAGQYDAHGSERIVDSLVAYE